MAAVKIAGKDKEKVDDTQFQPQEVQNGVEIQNRRSLVKLKLMTNNSILVGVFPA